LFQEKDNSFLVGHLSLLGSPRVDNIVNLEFDNGMRTLNTHIDNNIDELEK